MVSIVFGIVGVLGLWASHFANSNVHSQLCEQQIYFPTRAEFATAKPCTEITPGMIPYLRNTPGRS